MDERNEIILLEANRQESCTLMVECSSYEWSDDGEPLIDKWWEVREYGPGNRGNCVTFSLEGDAADHFFTETGWDD